MQRMFFDASSFDQDLSGWDTSSLISIEMMFGRATSFNSPVFSDVSNVGNFLGAFSQASAFSQDLCDSWGAQILQKTESLTPLNVGDMFQFTACPSGTEPYIAGGVVGSMCHICSIESGDLLRDSVDVYLGGDEEARAAHIARHGVIGSWDISRVESLDDVFADHSTFDEDIGDWNTSSVTSMAKTFKAASSFNQDISRWDVSQVTSMQDMFMGATNFNHSLSAWSTGAVMDFQGMFYLASDFNAPLFVDISSGSLFSRMFLDAESFSQDVCAIWGPSMLAKSQAGALAASNLNFMFTQTACSNRSDPDLSMTPISPLCFDCA